MENAPRVSHPADAQTDTPSRPRPPLTLGPTQSFLLRELTMISIGIRTTMTIAAPMNKGAKSHIAIPTSLYWLVSLLEFYQFFSENCTNWHEEHAPRLQCAGNGRCLRH